MAQFSRKHVFLASAVSFASGVLGTLLAVTFFHRQKSRKRAFKRLQQILNPIGSKIGASKSTASRRYAKWASDFVDFEDPSYARRLKNKSEFFDAKDASQDLSDYVGRLLLFPSLSRL